MMLQRTIAILAGLMFAAASIHTSASPARAQSNPLSDFPALSARSDWPWWRGPQRDGHADPSARPPVAWSDSQNVVWKTPVPGRGHSSPTLVGNQVFLTTADEAAEVQSVLAFDRDSGKPLWKTDISRGGFPRTHSKNTHASPTVACDGELLFVSFHHHDTLQVAALKRDGQIAWNKSLGAFRPRRYEYGYAPSPVLYRDTVIIAVEYDGDSYITALDRRSGEARWKTSRAANITFSTPSLQKIGGRDLLTISGSDKVSCYDPASGRLLWAVDGTATATCGTTVSDGDIIFASGGYPKSETVAVRVGPSGKVLWRNQQKCYEQSMLAHAGYLYAFTDNGVLYCFRGEDGQEMWRQRLRGPVSASPVLAGGQIYWANERGTMYVFKPNPQRFELTAENVLGDESFASPAVSGKRLYLRVASGSGAARQEYLYCLGE